MTTLLTAAVSRSLTALVTLTSIAAAQDLTVESGRHTLADVLSRCAAHAEIDHATAIATYGAAELTLQTRMELDAEECRRVVESFLALSGSPASEPVVRTFDVHSVPPAMITTSLRPMMPAGALCRMHVDGAKIVVEGPEGTVEWVGELIGEFDATLDDFDRSADLDDAAAPRVVRDHDLTIAAGEYSVADLIDRCADYLGHNIVYSSHTVADDARVEIASKQHWNEDDCAAELRRILVDLDLVVADLDRELGLFQVVSIGGKQRSQVLRYARGMSADSVLESRETPELVRCRVDCQGVDIRKVLIKVSPFAVKREVPLCLGTAHDGGLVLCGMKADVAKAIELAREAN